MAELRRKAAHGTGSEGACEGDSDGSDDSDVRDAGDSDANDRDADARAPHPTERRRDSDFGRVGDGDDDLYGGGGGGGGAAVFW